MAFPRSALLLLLGLASAEAVAHLRVSPEVDQSGKKFFNKNYPSDLSPKSDHPFNGPYPSVQSKSKFHNDFTSDDNGDAGEWKAQVEYDALRQKLKKDKDAAEKAFAKKQEELKELEKAREE